MALWNSSGAWSAVISAVPTRSTAKTKRNNMRSHDSAPGRLVVSSGAGQAVTTPGFQGERAAEFPP
jgi:hypothetical protein